MNCEVNGRCEFQNLMYRYDIDHDPFGKQPRYVRAGVRMCCVCMD